MIALLALGSCTALAPQQGPAQILYRMELLGPKGTITKPNIRDLDGQLAEITTSGPDGEMKIKLTPTLKAHGLISTQIKIHVSFHKESNEHGHSSSESHETDISTNFESRNGERVVFVSSEKGLKRVKMRALAAKHGEFVFSVTPRIVTER